MSAVKSQQAARGNLLTAPQHQTIAAQVPFSGFGHPYTMNQLVSGGMHHQLNHPPMQQNFRRGIGSCASSSLTSPNANSNRMSWRPYASNGNFAFIQSAGADEGASIFGNAVQASMSTEPMISRSAESENNMIKFLQQFGSEYSDDQLRHVLTESGWDTQKAIEQICALSYEENKSAHQKKSNETRSLFSQRMGESGQDTVQCATSYSTQYTIAKPSKRRRAQFDGQQNTVMQSTNQSSSNQISQRSTQIPTAPSTQETTQKSQPQQQQSQQPHVVPVSKAYAATVGSMVMQTLPRRHDDASRLNLVQEALEHFAEVTTKQQQSGYAAKLNQVNEQLSDTQRKLGRVEHDNKVLKKGFNAVMKKQSEWCKDSDEKEKLRCVLTRKDTENEELQKEISRLRMNLQKAHQHKQFQQASWSTGMMPHNFNNRHDDVM